jgi:hypothetical protein
MVATSFSAQQQQKAGTPGVASQFIYDLYMVFMIPPFIKAVVRDLLMIYLKSRSRRSPWVAMIIADLYMIYSRCVAHLIYSSRCHDYKRLADTAGCRLLRVAMIYAAP